MNHKKDDAMATTPTLCCSIDFEVEFDNTRKATTTGDPEPAEGLADLTFHLVAERGGSAIHPTLIASAAERTGKPGTYAIIETATLPM
jgi:hypothetical protein